MGTFDSFCGDLIEQAKRFLEKSKEDTNPDGKRAYLNSSLLLAMSALEAYVNGIANELIHMSDISILEESLLSEKDIELKNGEFRLKNQLKIYRTTDRIEFLHKKFTTKTIKEEKLDWWTPLKQSIELRNKIVHPKEKVDLTVEKVEKALISIIDCINSLYIIVYDKKLPIYNRGIDSKYDF